MATVNQSPAGQTSVAVSGISFASITATSTPFWRSIKTVVGGSFAASIGGTTTNLLAPAALLGKNASVSTSGANGMWTLQDQLAAKRASAWP